MCSNKRALELRTGFLEGAWARMPHSCQGITARNGGHVATVVGRALDRSCLHSFIILR